MAGKIAFHLNDGNVTYSLDGEIWTAASSNGMKADLPANPSVFLPILEIPLTEIKSRSEYSCADLEAEKDLEQLARIIHHNLHRS